MNSKLNSLRRSLGVAHFTVFITLLLTGFSQKPLLYPEPSLQERRFRVLIFLDTECPICQQTVQRVQEMAVHYKNQVQFEAVYPTETVTLAEITEFERAYRLTIPHHADPAHTLVKKYRATTTPEVVLVSPQNRILYRGSVDNQFYRLGRSRPQPTEFYLKDAITAVLANKPVSISETTPTGCLISQR